MTLKFKHSFDRFVCDGDDLTATVGNIEFRAMIRWDEEAGSPEENRDGFWPSLDPQADGYIGSNDRIEYARQKRQCEAVMAAWKRGEMLACGIVISVWIGESRILPCGAALWGVDCNWPGDTSEHLTETANMLLIEAAHEAKRELERLSRSISEAVEALKALA